MKNPNYTLTLGAAETLSPEALLLPLRKEPKTLNPKALSPKTLKVGKIMAQKPIKGHYSIDFCAPGKP